MLSLVSLFQSNWVPFHKTSCLMVFLFVNASAAVVILSTFPLDNSRFSFCVHTTCYIVAKSVCTASIVVSCEYSRGLIIRHVSNRQADNASGNVSSQLAAVLLSVGSVCLCRH